MTTPPPDAPLTDEQIADGMRLCDAATPAPWLLSLQQEYVETTQLAANGDIYDGHVWSPDFDGDQGPAERVDYLSRDGAFIAAARTLLPAALRELKAAREQIANAPAQEAYDAVCSALAAAQSRETEVRAQLAEVTKERDEAQALLSKTITDGTVVESMTAERIATWLVSDLDPNHPDTSAHCIDIAEDIRAGAWRKESP